MGNLLRGIIETYLTHKYYPIFELIYNPDKFELKTPKSVSQDYKEAAKAQKVLINKAKELIHLKTFVKSE